MSRESGSAREPCGTSPEDSKVVRTVTPIFGVLICLVALTFAAELHLKVGIVLFTEQGLAAILALALGVAFLKIPAKRGEARRKVPWYDVIFAVLGFGAGAYLSVRFPVLAEEFFYRQTEAFVVGLMVISLVIEALRRTAGWSLVIIVGLFLVYGLFGYLIPGKLQARSLEFAKLVAYLGVDHVAVFGLAMTIVCTVVVMFIFMGQLLLKSGGSEWFTDLATALMGGSRGGSAKVAVLASALFGSISGSAVANVASTGIITIPLMRQAGYRREVAGAFEAVASTGGQIMPPIMGAAAFLMAEFLDIPYFEVILAALIPAILYYAAVFIQTDLEAARRNIAPIPKDQVPPLGRVLKEGWFFTTPFIVLIFTLFHLNRTPEEAALWACVSIILVSWVFSYKGRRMSLRDLYLTVRDTGISAVDIVVIGAMAGMIIGIIEVTGLGFGLTFVLVEFGEGNLMGLLLLTALICIVLGMGMPTTAIYILVATLAAPPLVKLGVEPLAAHLFVFYFGIASMITPPVAVPAFVAAKLAGASPMKTAFISVRIGWTAYVVPFLFVFSPSLTMRGGAFEIALAFVTAVAGVLLATAGLLGYLFRPLAVTFRLGFLISGAALLVPVQAFPAAYYFEIGGVTLAGLLIGVEIIAGRRTSVAGS